MGMEVVMALGIVVRFNCDGDGDSDGGLVIVERW